MSDRFPGEPEWTDALQAGRDEPTGWESLHGVMAHDNHGLCEKIDEQAARIAQLERREALLTAFVVAYDRYFWYAEICNHEGCANPEALLPTLEPSQVARRALDWLSLPGADAGFTPDGWTEDKP